MLYQNLLLGENPYYISLGSVINFAEHRHPEVEFIYCIRGSFDIIIDRVTYTVSEGELALVAPMAAHEYKNKPDDERRTLVIEVGPALIRSHFSALTSAVFQPPVKRLDKTRENCRCLLTLLNDTAALCQSRGDCHELLIEGNIHKIFAYILREYSDGSRMSDSDFRAVANIEKALELIHRRYAEPITVEQAADITGYGKSNFCRIFKNIVGDTFHNVLNRRRVENACCILDETALPVADIAPLVGFADAKTLCRVFKTVTGTSPGQYRKNRNVRD